MTNSKNFKAKAAAKKNPLDKIFAEYIPPKRLTKYLDCAFDMGAKAGDFEQSLANPQYHDFFDERIEQTDVSVFFFDHQKTCWVEFENGLRKEVYLEDHIPEEAKSAHKLLSLYPKTAWLKQYKIIEYHVEIMSESVGMGYLLFQHV